MQICRDQATAAALLRTESNTHGRAFAEFVGGILQLRLLQTLIFDLLFSTIFTLEICPLIASRECKDIAYLYWAAETWKGCI